MEQAVVGGYTNRVAETKARLAQLTRFINRLSLSRLGVIVLGAVSIFRAVQAESVGWVLLLAIAVLVLFMWLVSRQSKAEQQKRIWQDMLAINENELGIRNGKPNVYDAGESYVDGKHPYTDDLDIFGGNSVYERLNRCATNLGRDRLAHWLGSAADELEVAQRQQATQEIAGNEGWSQDLQCALFFELKEKTDVKQRFARLMEDQAMAIGGRFLRLYVSLAPWLFVASGILAVFFPIMLRLLVVVGVGHLMVSFWYAGKIGRVSSHVDRAGQLLASYAAAFRQIEETQWKSDLTRTLAGRLVFNQSESASAVFGKLAKLVNKLDYRLNMLIGALLNMVFLWDLKQVFAILEWRSRYQGEVMGAFDTLAEFEALNALAIWHVNHPQWAFPTVLPSEQRRIACEGIAHPLIPERISVANNYELENHRIALITGSNMAGKSTFLRTVGVNMVLAFAGAVVCARRMEVSVAHLVTYMRIKDSLNESTSTFKAELDRMQLILGEVKDKPYTYFLIDEMLRGTNSVDKYLGSKAIIQQLISYQGYGMVATHDLKLAELEKAYPQDVRNYHFDIQVSDGEMLFDYKLKEGECTIFNASLLLRRIGVHVEKE